MRFYLRFFGYAVALAAAYFITYADALTGTYAETNWTEVPQEFLLLLMVIMHGLTAKRSTHGRAFNVLFGGLALASLIREHNNQLADIAFHSAWLVGVVPVVAATIIYSWLHRKQLFSEIAEVRDTFGFGVLMIGLGFLHIFTRLFGANDLWYATMGDDYMRVVARTAEEGTELVAYTMIFIGTLEVTRGWWQRQKQRQ